MYGDGQTRDGVWDLSGDVYEWTLDANEDGGWPYLKGGSWPVAQDRGKSAARGGNSPDRSDFYFGFRCIVVPISG